MVVRIKRVRADTIEPLRADGTGSTSKGVGVGLTRPLLTVLCSIRAIVTSPAVSIPTPKGRSEPFTENRIEQFGNCDRTGIDSGYGV